MRLIYPCLSLLVAGFAVRAAATSCLYIEDPWQDPEASPLDGDDALDGAPGVQVQVPVDASVWELVPCGPKEPATRPRCEAIDAADARVPVTTTLVGDDYCQHPREDRVEYTHIFYLRHYTPTQPLTPGQTYTLECEDAFPGSFTVRDTTTPAAEPTPIEVNRTWLRRGDDGGCCGSTGDVLELYVADRAPAFLAEGGYIEAKYPSGQHLVLGPTSDDHFSLPGAHSDIELTPVSASGVRGETLTIDGDDLYGEAVYIPCDIRGQRPTAALWLLLPLLALRVQTRRRRSA